MSETVSLERSFLPWQQTQWHRLQQRHASDSLPHALLLSGPRYVGKLHFADQFARYLLCDSPSPAGPCDACKSCQLYLAHSHPDVKFLQPEESGKAIKVDAVRDTVSFVNKTPQMSGYRVLIVAPAEAMNSNAANAFLKSLEEPGRDTLMLLVSHEVSRLLATIRSRCQRVDFPLPPTDMAQQWLQNLIPAEDTAQRLAIANGAPLKALSLGDSACFQQRHEIAEQFAGLIQKRLDAVAVAGLWKQYELNELLTLLSYWLLDAVKLRLTGDEQQIANRDIAAALAGIAGQITEQGLMNAYENLVRARSTHSSSANPNPQLLLEDLLISCTRL